MSMGHKIITFYLLNISKLCVQLILHAIRYQIKKHILLNKKKLLLLFYNLFVFKEIKLTAEVGGHGGLPPMGGIIPGGGGPRMGP